MALDGKIVKVPRTSPKPVVPVIIAMIDSDGIIQAIPFKALPFSDEVSRELYDEVIYGVELMINPASLSTNISKIINRTQTMTCFIEDHWGEEIDTITLQGFTAAFVTGAQDIYTSRVHQNSPTKNYLERTTGAVQGIRGYGSGIHDDEIGLTTSQRRRSVSYRHFKRLLDLFRVNGCFFDSFGLVFKRYYIMVSYGSSAYKGFFESIDVTETAENPFRFQYTITFKSQETIYSYIAQVSTKNPVSLNNTVVKATGIKGSGG
jgi:hypothetical protein